MTSSNTVVNTIDVGRNLWRVALSTDGAYVYVGDDDIHHDADDAGSVSVIRTFDDTVIKRVCVDGNPAGIVVAPDTMHAYIVNSIQNGTVSVIDPSQL